VVLTELIRYNLRGLHGRELVSEHSTSIPQIITTFAERKVQSFHDGEDVSSPHSFRHTPIELFFGLTSIYHRDTRRVRPWL